MSDQPKWHIDGTLIYQLEHAGWRKGQELTRNRLTVSVQGNSGGSHGEAEALAHRIADFLNTPTPHLQMVGRALRVRTDNMDVLLDGFDLPPVETAENS
ncbi:MAG: hypothetical protein P4L85_14295 [Paludisphaera borealis]|uniref:hypothetical protein n=1 Tax=Paludisphaera borealis TaxID=1387353 RepID=UPI00284E863E|nr:hypothetical protein [Paludisphaera borealis]MDR3620517.1 hypothetical protein [Paludisphaera borealis]